MKKKDKFDLDSDVFDENSEEDEKNLFVKKLEEHLHLTEVELSDGSMVSNIDGIIDNLIGRALDGDIAICKLIRDLLNNR